MGRIVKRLTGLEIDEVSLVNRPANQHGLVTIAKSYQEDNMGVYDAAGDEVFEEELEHGDRVYDDAGNEFVFIEEGVEDEEGDDEVEKGSFSPVQAFKNTQRFGAKKTATAYKNRVKGNVSAAGAKAKAGANTWADAHPTAFTGAALGGAAVAGAGAGYAGGRMQKSLGTQVLEELSKALTDNDRDQVFAKAADRFDEIADRNSQLEELVLGLYEDRDAEGFSELAKSYQLPVDPDEIGGIMHRASQVLPDEDLQALDRLFSSYGEIAKAAFTEIGYNGGMESDVLGQIFGMAGQEIVKNDNSFSQEQAVTALFSANPGAYDEYEAEQRRR